MLASDGNEDMINSYKMPNTFMLQARFGAGTK